MCDTIRKWLEDGVVDVFLGYKAVDGHFLPWVFKKSDLSELKAFCDGPYRYSLEKMAWEILQEDEHVRVGLLARQCTERAVTMLQALQALDPQRLWLLSRACCASPGQTQVVCSALTSHETSADLTEEGIPEGTSIQVFETLQSDEKFSRWMYEFEKCFKCYGCRDICHVCVCKECTLQDPELIETGSLPTEVPLFHLVRAVHMAGRCIDCGLCEEACPAHIPLRALYQKVGLVVRELYGYVPGQKTVPLIWGPLSDGEMETLASGM